MQYKMQHKVPHIRTFRSTSLLVNTYIRCDWVVSLSKEDLLDDRSRFLTGRCLFFVQQTASQQFFALYVSTSDLPELESHERDSTALATELQCRCSYTIFNRRKITAINKHHQNRDCSRHLRRYLSTAIHSCFDILLYFLAMNIHFTDRIFTS